VKISSLSFSLGVNSMLISRYFAVSETCQTKNPLRSYVRQMRGSLGVRPTSAGRKCRHSCMKKVFAASLDPPR
jgi:hypothetical protein